MHPDAVAHVTHFTPSLFKPDFLVRGVRIQAMNIKEAHSGDCAWEGWPVVWQTKQPMTLDMLRFIFGGLFANGMYLLRWEVGDSIQGHYMDPSEFRDLSE